MLIDQETPEMSEEQNLDLPQSEEHPTPPEEGNPEPQREEEKEEKKEENKGEEAPAPEAESPAEEVAAAEEEVVAEASPAAEADPPAEESAPSEKPVAEAPSAHLPVEQPSEEAPAAEPVAQDAAPSPEASAEEEASSATAEAPRAELATVPTPENLEPLDEAVVQRVSEIMTQKGASTQVLAQATISDLVHLMDLYLVDANTLAQAPKVGLVKRSYDTLKYQEELPKDLEELFLNRLAVYNQKRIAEQRKLDDVREVNLARKRELLEKLKGVVEQDDPYKIEEVRQLQNEWKAIGQVPKAQLDQLYTDYRMLLDRFYQLREMHFELLDYDRKINLQEKERLIEEAKANLIPSEEQREDPEVWREKMDLLGELQQQWKSVGHVPREDMDRINGAYRAIIDEFFEIRQGFRDKMDELRQENAVQKEALLAKMEEYRDFEADRPRAWNDASRAFREMQEAYKAIGQAPQRVNGELWARYRDVCNAFYSKKSAFFQKFDEFRQENLEKKKKLVERAEELAAGDEWERSAKELKRLQREWKEIGPVPERQSNKLWGRFRTACDAFFEARRAHYQVLHAEEHENLEKKKQLIAEVKKVAAEGKDPVPKRIERIKQIQKEWRQIGKVPYKEKDKIWDEFRAEVDAFFNGLPAKRSEVREMQTKTTIDSIDDREDRSKAIKDNISRLRRKISKARETITQYQENMDRIARGKSGDKLRQQIEDEVAKEKRLIADHKKQITELNDMLKNPPKEEKPPEKEAEAANAEAADEAPVAEAPQADTTEEKPEAKTEETTEFKPEEKTEKKTEAKPEEKEKE